MPEMENPTAISRTSPPHFTNMALNSGLPGILPECGGKKIRFKNIRLEKTEKNLKK